MPDISTAERPSAYDPLDRMEPGEGRFILREKDHASPEAMTEWARVRRNWAIKTYGDDSSEAAKRKLKAELEQCRDAENLALEWRERQAGGEPEEGVKILYQDVQRTESQVAEERRRKNLALARQHAREVAYYVAEIVESEGADNIEAYAPLLAALNAQNMLADGLDTVRLA